MVHKDDAKVKPPPHHAGAFRINPRTTNEVPVLVRTGTSFNMLYLYTSLTANYDIARCLRRSEVRTLSVAIGFSPLNVVRHFNSARFIVRSNFAIHSSAKELLTTSTPVKSRTTSSFCSIRGSNFYRTRLPSRRIPKFSPYSLKLMSPKFLKFIIIQESK